METHKTLPQHKCSPYNSTSETSAPCIIQLPSENVGVFSLGGHSPVTAQQQQGWLVLTGFSFYVKRNPFHIQTNSPLAVQFWFERKKTN